MTDKLLPCPFCGGEAYIAEMDVRFISCGQKEYETVIKCEDCGASIESEVYRKDRIAEAWNTRTERTCRMEYNEKASGDEIYPTEAYTCSLCRCVTLDGKPNYCPNCGAKVVER